jgi:hypothetical protein
MTVISWSFAIGKTPSCPASRTADICSAFDQIVFDGTIAGEEHKHLLVGLDRNGNPLEILYNVLEGNAVNVFHAMKCRKAWRSLRNP